MSIDLHVSDLLCPLSNDWDLEKVRAALPHYEDEIRSLITSSAPSRDRFAWLPDKPGLYTTRSDDDAVLTDGDEVDGKETGQENSWIDDDKCLKDDDGVDESLALGEETGQGTNGETITSLPGQGTT
ncbi:hypothetical protein YC2023_082001 [Brassica napus]